MLAISREFGKSVDWLLTGQAPREQDELASYVKVSQDSSQVRNAAKSHPAIENIAYVLSLMLHRLPCR
jgi:hypothetical protein